MSDFLAGIVRAPGALHTVAANTDFLVWIPYAYRSGTTSSSAQTFGGVALTELQDNTTDITGGGDPTAALAYLNAPTVTEQALDNTWSTTPTLEGGYALSFQNVDLTTPIGAGVTGQDSATYGADNAPSLTYSAEADDIILYYKYHCTNSASTIATPAGFTLIENVVTLTSPAYRQLSFYYKKAAATETSVALSGDTSGSSAVGGIHGFAVLKNATAPVGVNIGTVDTDNTVEIGQIGIAAPGSGYEAVQGTGTVTISPTDNIADASALTVTATAWADELVNFTIPTTFAMMYGTVYLFITNDSAEVNAAGKALALVPPVLNDYLVIREQNDLGILKDIAGIELDADQLEYQKLSVGGGTVYMGISGTYYIYNYSGAVPATDSILFRVGDASDGTWSSDSLIAFDIGSVEATVSGDIAQAMNGFTQLATGTVIEDTSSGAITQSVNSFTQVASGTVTVSQVTAAITQSLNSFSQTATGTVSDSSVGGIIVQAMNSFSQTATGSVLSNIVAGSITQQLNAFTQAALGIVFTVGNPPSITQPPHAVVAKGATFSYTPSLSSGSDVQWKKEFGPDGMTVDPETGEVTWDTTSIPRGQGLRVTLRCSNSDGEDLSTFIVHVDEIGTSKIMLLNGAVDTAGGTPTTVATTLRAAAAELNSGDTLVIPDGSFFASTTSQNSAENTWDEQNLNELPTGLSNQHTTIISDGYTIIDSAPHDAILRDDKGLSSGPSNTGEFYKFSGIEWTGSNRGPIVFRMNGALLEFCGGTDGSYAVTPLTQAEAGDPFANVAGTYIGTNCTAENCFGFGDARYIFQSGNVATGASFNRCIARPDEYNGTNPRGGIIHYSVDDSGTFSSYVIDGDQEHLSPFYNNYAGSFGLPATGNETHAQSQLMRGCAAINVDMNAILNDSNSATNTLVIEDFLLLDTTNTVTPWTGATSLMGIQSDSVVNVTRLAMSETHRWDFDATNGGVFMGASNGSTVDGAIFDRLGWDGSSATIALADLVGSSVTLDNANVYDFKASIDQAGSSTPTTNVTTYDPKINGWDYPTRAETGSPVALLNQAPDLTKFAAPSNYLPTDVGWDVATSDWAWPHPEEQHIASRMRTYSKSGMAVRNPVIGVDPVDLTGTITGNRGFAADTESFSEYIWGQFGRTVPPLSVSAKTTNTGEVTFRIGKYRSFRGNTITQFKVYETSDLINPVATTATLKAVVTGISGGSHTYVIKAVDATQLSAWGANEAGESGPSEELTVTVSSLPGTSGVITQTLNAFTQTASGTTAAVSEVAGSITQTLNSFSQTASGTLGILGVSGGVVQTLNSFSQIAFGTITGSSAVTGSITQQLNSFTQIATGLLGDSVIVGTIAQTLNNFSQTASGTVNANSAVTGSITQNMSGFTQQLSGSVIVGSIAVGSINQTLNSFTQSLTGTITQLSSVTGSISQTLNAFTQAATGTVTSVDAIFFGNQFTVNHKTVAIEVNHELVNIKANYVKPTY